MPDEFVNAYEQIEMRMREEEDAFIFEAIKPYCEYVTRMTIDKTLLKRALKEYFANHPEEREGR